MVNRQQGAASAVAVTILLILVFGMVMATMMMSSSSINSSLQSSNKLEALYLVESQAERIISRLNNEAALFADCNNLTTGSSLNYGSGSFQIDSITIPNPPNDSTQECVLRLSATVDNVVRLVDGTFFNSGGTGGGGGTDFQEQFDPDSATFEANWTEVPTSSMEGVSRWDAYNCPSASCPGSLGGSFYVETQFTGGPGNSRTMDGYREINITPFTTPAGGLNINLTGVWIKQSSDGVAPNQQRFYIDFVDTGGGVQTIWSDTTKSGNSGLQFINQAFTLPGSTTFDRVRMRFYFIGRKTGGGGGTWHHPQMFVDELSVSGISGAGVAPDWGLVEWAEVDK